MLFYVLQLLGSTLLPGVPTTQSRANNAQIASDVCYWHRVVCRITYLTKLLLIPSTNSNLIVALVVGRVDVIYLMCNIHYIFLPSSADYHPLVVLGTILTASANIFFAAIEPSQSYWAYGLPSAILSVFGADFVFSAGTLFIAKVALPHEQSVAGALFQMMTQVSQQRIREHIRQHHTTSSLEHLLVWR